MKLPIGVSDFKKLRESGYLFVDKSGFVTQVLDGAEIQLITRPRRFGKTLNLSMLYYFLQSEPETRRELFQHSHIADDPRMDQPAQPVIFLTLKDMKQPDFATFLDGFGVLIAELYRRFVYLRQRLTSDQQADFDRYLSRTAGFADLTRALAWLTGLLADHHNQRVVVLIDEYDTPIHEAWCKDAADYYSQTLELICGFLGQALKDNSAIDKAVLTGILRVSKESIFSDLNNVFVHSVLDYSMADCFGFTEDEVSELLNAAGHEDRMDVTQRWYNGYQIAGKMIYNPWSVLNFLARDCRRPAAYWLNTSGNTLIHQLLTQASPSVHEGLERLMAGENLQTELQDQVVFDQLSGNDKALWSFLLFAGYLTTFGEPEDEEHPVYALRIPNHEVRLVYRDTFYNWLQVLAFGSVDGLFQSLIQARWDLFQTQLTALMRAVLSYYDTSGREAERVYHAFMLGLLSHLHRDYEIRSNRESGLGRYDCLMRPRNTSQPGFVLEFKTFSGDDPTHALEAALDQIRDRDYSSELNAAGVAMRYEVAVAFNGKDAFVSGIRRD